MYVSKWYSLAAAAVLQLIAGVAYTFSLYSGSLKSALHFSQPELEGVGSAILCGGLFAFVPGFVYDSLIGYHKLGPRLTGLIGLVSHFCGYLGIWAAAAGHFDAPYWLIIAFGLLASSGLLWLDTSAIVTSMRNFPMERGDVAGTLKTFLGLSASIATTIYGGLFAPKGLDFLLFLAIGPPALGLLVVPLLNHVPYIEESEVAHEHKLTTGRRFLAIYAVVAALLVYQLATALIGEVHSLAHGQRLGITVGALVILSGIVFIPAATGGICSKPASFSPRLQTGGNSSSQVDPNPLLAASAGAEGIQRRSTNSAPEEMPAAEAVTNDAEAGTRKDTRSSAPREWTLRQSLCSADFWMLWIGLFIGIGSGFTFLNNLGQHVESLGAHKGAEQVYVLLFATFNCLGRMLCGFGSEWMLHRYAVPRTAVLLSLSASTAVTYAVIAIAGLRLLLLCAIVGGLLFGAHWALMPSCTSDLFGLQHFASNQSIVHLSTAVGALLLSTELAGKLYQERGHEHGDPEGTCFGADCFRLAFLVIAALALLQTGLSCLLYLRSRPLYRQMHAKLRRFDLDLQY